MPDDPILKMARLAASKVPKGAIIGLGSGSTVAAFVKALAKKETAETLVVIPSSLQIETAALEAGLKISSPAQINNIQWSFDGADQVDKKLNLLKGGGGALFRERILLAAAKRRVIMVDEGKVVEKINRPVPIEVSPFARWYVKEMLGKVGGRAVLRTDRKGYPFITENGNIILDTDFGEIDNPRRLHIKIKGIVGVVDTGLFTLPFCTIYVASADGSVNQLTKGSS